MSNWDKDSFIEHMRENCNREIAKIGESIIQFAENHASDISWGRGSDHGTMTFRCNSDDGNFTLEWNSKPNKTYSLYYSLDLSDWEADIDDSIESEGETTSYSFEHPEGKEARKIFFKVIAQ